MKKDFYIIEGPRQGLGDMFGVYRPFLSLDKGQFAVTGGGRVRSEVGWDTEEEACS
jgi:hypothetical protein